MEFWQKKGFSFSQYAYFNDDIKKQNLRKKIFFFRTRFFLSICLHELFIFYFKHLLGETQRTVMMETFFFLLLLFLVIFFGAAFLICSLLYCN